MQYDNNKMGMGKNIVGPFAMVTIITRIDNIENNMDWLMVLIENFIISFLSIYSFLDI